MSDASQSGRARELSTHYGLCEAELRGKDRDLWLADLFALKERRRHLHALQAFALEIDEVRAKVSQPLLGEMRLRWWKDAIEGSGEAGANAHPVADALIDTIRSFDLPREEFERFLDAHDLELYDDRLETTASLIAYCENVGALPLRWAARCLDGDRSALARQALNDAGAALALTRVLRRLSRGGAHQLLPLELAPETGAVALREPAMRLLELAEARFGRAEAAARELDDPTRAALLPAATLPLYFEKLRSCDYGQRRPAEEPSAWRRQWRLWRAARAGL